MKEFGFPVARQFQAETVIFAFISLIWFRERNNCFDGSRSLSGLALWHLHHISYCPADTRNFLSRQRGLGRGWMHVNCKRGRDVRRNLSIHGLDDDPWCHHCGWLSGNTKFGRQVQVSESSDVELADLGSPQQRLATSLRAEGDGKQSGNTELSGAGNLEVKSASLKKQPDALDPKLSVATTDTADAMAGKVVEAASSSAEVASASQSRETTDVNVQSSESKQPLEFAAVMDKSTIFPPKNASGFADN